MSKTTKTKVQIGAFVLNNDATYDWSVYPEVPGPGGKRVKVKIGCQFKHVSPQRRVEIMEEWRERLKARESAAKDAEQGDEVEAATALLSYEEMLLQEVLVSFSNVRTPAGDELECNDETKSQLIANSWARDALMKGYFQSLKSRDDQGN